MDVTETSTTTDAGHTLDAEKSVQKQSGTPQKSQPTGKQSLEKTPGWGPAQPQVSSVERPRLSAKALVVARGKMGHKIVNILSDGIPVVPCPSVVAFDRQISNEVALVIVSLDRPDEELEHIVKYSLAGSKHAHIVFVGEDSIRMLRCDVPRDEAFVLPHERTTMGPAIETLYLRAYYSIALERYYRLCVSIANLELRAKHEQEDLTNDQHTNGQYTNGQHTNGDSTNGTKSSRTTGTGLAETDLSTGRFGNGTDELDLDDEGQTQEDIEALLDDFKRQREVTKSYLDRFRRVLSRDDYEDMLDRETRYSSLFPPGKRSPDPAAFGLSQSCTKCGFDWTTWHGQRYGYGYEQIGANTWRCTNCNDVLGDNDPNNYRVG